MNLHSFLHPDEPDRTSISLSQEQLDALDELCKSPATRIIEELHEMESRQKAGNRLSLVLAMVGTIASVVAAVTGIIVLFQP